MKNYSFLLLFCIPVIMGILFFAFLQNWIIIRLPTTATHKQHAPTITKKTVQLIFWHNNKWNTEKTDLIWSEKKDHNLYYLINSWLSLLDEEEIMTKKVSLQTALLVSSGQEAYLSFDRNPLDKERSTFDKWMWIEGLLKTIRENNITIQKVRLLVHHQPLHDNHLDFSKPWPLIGFIKNNS